MLLRENPREFLKNQSFRQTSIKPEKEKEMKEYKTTLFTIYKNGEVWSHILSGEIKSSKIALKVYCKANMIENNGELTCDKGEREEEIYGRRI